MPVHEYKCARCGQVTEQWSPRTGNKKLTERRRCDCGGFAKRQLSATSLIFKGDGWTTKGSVDIETLTTIAVWVILGLAVYLCWTPDLPYRGERAEVTQMHCEVEAQYVTKPKGVAEEGAP